MLRSFFRQTVEGWLANNIDRFDRMPYVTGRSRHHIELAFTGIPETLYVHLSNRGLCEIGVWQNDTVWDFLGDFDLAEQRTSEGFYFCGFCLRRKLYPSRRELWIQHSLEALLAWANRELKSGRALYLYELREGGSTWAWIRPAPGLEGAEEARGARYVYPFE